MASRSFDSTSPKVGSTLPHSPPEPLTSPCSHLRSRRACRSAVWESIRVNRGLAFGRGGVASVLRGVGAGGGMRVKSGWANQAWKRRPMLMRSVSTRPRVSVCIVPSAGSCPHALERNATQWRQSPGRAARVSLGNSRRNTGPPQRPSSDSSNDEPWCCPLVLPRNGGRSEPNGPKSREEPPKWAATPL